MAPDTNELLIADDYLGRVIAFRREMHSKPELAYAEHHTAEKVASWLKALDFEVETGIGGTGVVGLLRRGNSNRMIGFRADMDALPIHEQSGVSYASTSPGKMHACGHDGHVAMLLGAAEVLKSWVGLNGQVAFIFQPAEERGAGAQKMIDEGLFERYPVEGVYGIHNWPEMPQGKFAMRAGPVMGAGLRFCVTVHGRGAHAAQPHRGVDPIPAICSIVQAYQTLVARECDPVEPVVVSVTQLSGGTAQNAVPESARLAGTARFASPAMLTFLEERMRHIAETIAQAYGSQAVIEFEHGYPATVNTAAEAEICIDVMREAIGEANVITNLPVSLTSEDFGYMLQVKPGTYGLLGTRRNEGDPGLHHPKYDFNDEAMTTGINYWVQLAARLLR